MKKHTKTKEKKKKNRRLEQPSTATSSSPIATSTVNAVSRSAPLFSFFFCSFSCVYCLVERTVKSCSTVNQVEQRRSRSKWMGRVLPNPKGKKTSGGPNRANPNTLGRTQRNLFWADFGPVRMGSAKCNWAKPIPIYWYNNVI